MTNTPIKIILLIETSRCFGRSVIRGISRYSRDHGPWEFYRVPGMHRCDAGEKAPSLKKLKEWGANGIIMREPHNIEQLKELKLPAIICPYLRKPMPNVITIDGDHEAEGRMAAMYYIDRAFKNVAYVGLDDFAWSHGLARSFRKTADEAGVKAHVYHQPKKKSQRSWINEERILSEWLLGLEKPVGVFACTDERGRDCLQAASNAGLAVPDEVAVLGLDNDDMVCEITTPAMSSIIRSTETAGYRAAAMLDEQIRSGKRATGKVIIDPVRVVSRQSTDIFAIEDDEVAKAVSFIRTMALGNINVDDTVEVTTLSRRMLELRFKRSLGRSIAAEIRRVKLSEARKMLIETDFSVAKIAEKSGFTTVAYFSNFFSSAQGISPLEYRRRFRNS
ncbi:MAG: DNA-binding transcriptional regulator [Anaerohalosphaera sp.]|nr:DNA-binding transcriptional regulator [Anaerohalosphaera sp.]